MSAVPVPVALNLKAALAYIKAGLNPIPVTAGDKVPLLTAWTDRTAATPEEAYGWFEHHPNLNVGLICGPQPNERYLWTLDVDPKHGGDQRLYELEQQFEPLPDTAWHSTPSGGKHFFFEGPADYPYTNPKVMVGLDTRTHGGQVVVPPSQTLVGAYTHVLSNAVHRAPWAPVPSWLLEVVEASRRPSPPERPTTSLVLPGRWSSADFVHDHYDWVSYLLKHGWVHVRGELWRHPAATNEHSAALKNNGMGPLNVWSTSMPHELERLDRSRTAGTLVFSLFDFIAAYEFGGDTSALARFIWERHGRADLGVRATPQADSTGRPGQSASAVGTTVPSLPDEFWTALPQFAHIGQMADAELAARGGMLIIALARTSALISPSYRLPGFGGSTVGTATLDLMGCVVAETGVGKSLAAKVGRSLLPDPEADEPLEKRKRLIDPNPGSGEGLIDAYYTIEKEPDDDGKLVDVRRVRRQAVFLNCDEGNAFIKVADRKGVTIVETMNSAWSGETLGNLNTASGGRMRYIPAQQVRFSAVIHIQASDAWKLFDERFTTVGFAGRLLYGLAWDPDATGEVVATPGPMAIPNWPHYGMAGKVFTYDPAIHDEVRARRLQSLRGVIDDARRSQHLVLQCKVAAILAFWGDSLHVSAVHWALAGTVLAYSAACLDYLSDLRALQQRDADHRANERKVRVTQDFNTSMYESDVVRFKGRILTAVRKHKRRTRREVKDLSDAPRDALFGALDELIAEGLLVVVDGAYEEPS